MPLAIRLADPADAASIAGLVQSAYRGDGSRTGWTTEADLLKGTRVTPEQVAPLLTDPGIATLVLADDAGLLATCQVRDGGDGLAVFGLFAVRPNAQNAGTGRRMVAAAEAHAVQAWGATHLELQVLEPRAELIAWYERLGFARTGELRPFRAAAAVRQRQLVDGLRFVVLRKPLG